QYEPERIVAEDVQTLMHKVTITPDESFSDRFPEEMPARLTVTLTDGTSLGSEHNAYEGFHTVPVTWPVAEEKFNRLTAPFAPENLRRRLIEIVQNLQDEQVSTLTDVLAQVSRTRS